MSKFSDTNRDKPQTSSSSGMTSVDHPSTNTTIEVSPRRTAIILLWIVVTIVTVGTIANYCIYHVASSPDSNVAKVLRRFDLGHEPSIPNMYSAAALLSAAMLLALIGRLEQRGLQKGWTYWYGMAIVFVGLSIDEAVLFHEMVNAAINNFVPTTGVFFLPWVIVGGLFALVFACLFIPFVARKSKRTLGLFIVAGSIFVFGAIGMEMLASLIFESAGSEEMGVQRISYTISQAIEELCEMLGIIIFIYALLDYLASHFPLVELRFAASVKPKMQ